MGLNRLHHKPPSYVMDGKYFLVVKGRVSMDESWSRRDDLQCDLLLNMSLLSASLYWRFTHYVFIWYGKLLY